MPPKKWNDKSKATTYRLVHRAQNDPLYHDASSSSMVFQEVAPKQARKTKNRDGLESESFSQSDLSSVLSQSDAAGIRDNEGEAAEHGIYFDDTEYDYMQHMRDLGGDNTGSATAVWISAEEKQGKGKQKQKQSLADALAQLDIEHEMDQAKKEGKLIDQSILPASGVRRTTYQEQLDVPDEIAGFQPDMDPRLREVLEALEDDAYVDETEEGDLFASIAEGGEEISLAEFEDGLYDDEDGDWMDEDEEGYESDKTIKAHELNDHDDEVPQLVRDGAISLSTPNVSAVEVSTEDGDFMSSFRNLPSSVRKPISDTTPAPAASLFSAAPSSLLSGMKRKKRKGALTDTSSFSMTSSSIARTEGLLGLDARFEKTLESYAEDDEDEGEYDDNMSMASGMTGLSQVSGLSKMSGMSGFSTASQRQAMSELVNSKGFNSVMDEFLSQHEIKGRRRVRKGDHKTGMEELDEIRNALGRKQRIDVGRAGAASGKA